jgi:murein DD-endopeptidase MepM/ murein hydrolase activator NlpD
MVVLDHGAGVFTGYCHLSAYAVRADEEVPAGQVIAAVGSSGLATGPHLHWEVVVGGYHVNGLLWLTPE